MLDLTPDEFADLRTKTLTDPRVVERLLLDRIAELEHERHTVAVELECADDACAHAAQQARQRVAGLEAFLGRLHGQTDAAQMNQAIWRFLNPKPPPSRMGEPDEESD